MINLKNYKFDNSIYSDPYRKANHLTKRHRDSIMQPPKQVQKSFRAPAPATTQSKKSSCGMMTVIKTIGLGALALAGAGIGLHYRDCSNSANLATRLSESRYSPQFLRDFACDMALNRVNSCATTQEKIANFLKVDSHCNFGKLDNGAEPKWNDPKNMVLSSMFESALKEWPLDNARIINDMKHKKEEALTFWVAYANHISESEDIDKMADVLKLEEDSDNKFRMTISHVYYTVMTKAHKTGNYDFAVKMVQELKKSKYTSRFQDKLYSDAKEVLQSSLSNRCEIAERLSLFLEKDKKLGIYNQIHSILLGTNRSAAKEFRKKLDELENSIDLNPNTLRFDVNLHSIKKEFQQAREKANLIQHPVDRLLAYSYIYKAYMKSEISFPTDIEITKDDFVVAAKYLKMEWKQVISADILDLQYLAEQLEMDDIVDIFEQILIEQDKMFKRYFSKLGESDPLDGTPDKEDYRILGLSEKGDKATAKEIKKAYLKKALVLHPDKNKDSTEAEFIKLQKAYQATYEFATRKSKQQFS